MYGMGHGYAVHAIVGVVIATAFLVWVAGKEGNPYKGFGKVIGWIAFVLSALLVIGSVIACFSSMKAYGWKPWCMRGQMMHEMMEEGKMPMGPMMMHPGMRMGPMAMPPAEEKK
jgi:hypothetical protein